MRRVGVIVGAMVLGSTGLMSLTGCGGDGPAAPAPLTAEQRLNLGVVAIDAQIGTERVRSSGAVIDGDSGLILTSAHTVWGARSLRVTTGVGVLHGRLVGRAPCDDLALVETQPRLPGLEALPPAGATPSGESLLSAVGRREAEPDVGAGSLLTIPTRAAATGVRASLGPRLHAIDGAIRLDAPIVPEGSGGALVDSSGRLVGMAIAKESADAVAVPWQAIEARLDELRPGPRRVFVGWRDQYRCAGRLHRYASAEHAGYQPQDARIDAPVPAARLPGTHAVDAE